MSPRAFSETGAPLEGENGLTGWDYLRIVRRRLGTVVLVAAVVFAALAAYAFLSTPIYRASALLDIERVNDGAVAQPGGNQYPDDDYLATQAKLIISDSALKKVYEELRLERTPEFGGGLGALRGAVTVLAVPRTRLFYVNAESADPRLAASVANALTENFIKVNLDNQLFMPKDVLHALRTRAKGPGALKLYEALPAVINNAVIQKLKGQILDGEVALADMRGKYTAQHPAVVAMEQQLALMRAARDRELDNVVRSVTIQLSGQLRPNNMRLIDSAKPPTVPARPRSLLALLLALVFGPGLGILAAVALDSRERAFSGVLDIERRLGLAFVGRIPAARRRGKREKVYASLISAAPSPSAEAFRDLRTMLTIAKERNGDPVLMVTSTGSEEGKSVVATNLAVALSQQGRRTLIVDGDLRRPTQHVNLGSPTGPGLSDYLSGRVAAVEELLQKTDLPNLDVIAAGEIPPNGSDLLDGEQLARLLDWARGRYDRVVVDGPPVFPGGDVLLWGRHVRDSILVSRNDRARLGDIRRACDRLRAGGIDVLGGVLNGA